MAGWDRHHRDQLICNTFTVDRSMQLLVWARKNGCAWNGPAVCNRAARGGHMSIVKYAREDGCSWDASICIGAAEGNETM